MNDFFKYQSIWNLIRNLNTLNCIYFKPKGPINLIIFPCQPFLDNKPRELNASLAFHDTLSRNDAIIYLAFIPPILMSLLTI